MLPRDVIPKVAFMMMAPMHLLLLALLLAKHVLHPLSVRVASMATIYHLLHALLVGPIVIYALTVLALALSVLLDTLTQLQTTVAGWIVAP